jgi:hypothetical protein
MEYRIRKLIMDHGSYRDHVDFEGIYSALQEVISYDLEKINNELLVDTISSLRKCDNCGNYEMDYLVSSTTLVLNEDGEHGMICDFCRGEDIT